MEYRYCSGLPKMFDSKSIPCIAYWKKDQGTSTRPSSSFHTLVDLGAKKKVGYYCADCYEKQMRARKLNVDAEFLQGNVDPQVLATITDWFKMGSSPLTGGSKEDIINMSIEKIIVMYALVGLAHTLPIENGKVYNFGRSFMLDCLTDLGWKSYYLRDGSTALKSTYRQFCLPPEIALAYQVKVKNKMYLSTNDLKNDPRLLTYEFDFDNGGAEELKENIRKNGPQCQNILSLVDDSQPAASPSSSSSLLSPSSSFTCSKASGGGGGSVPSRLSLSKGRDAAFGKLSSLGSSALSVHSFERSSSNSIESGRKRNYYNGLSSEKYNYPDIDSTASYEELSQRRLASQATLVRVAEKFNKESKTSSSALRNPTGHSFSRSPCSTTNRTEDTFHCTFISSSKKQKTSVDRNQGNQQGSVYAYNSVPKDNYQKIYDFLMDKNNAPNAHDHNLVLFYLKEIKFRDKDDVEFLSHADLKKLYDLMNSVIPRRKFRNLLNC